MRYLFLLVTLLLVGCSQSPTEPKEEPSLATGPTYFRPPVDASKCPAGTRPYIIPILSRGTYIWICR